MAWQRIAMALAYCLVFKSSLPWPIAFSSSSPLSAVCARALLVVVTTATTKRHKMHRELEMHRERKGHNRRNRESKRESKWDKRPGIYETGRSNWARISLA